MICIKCNQPMKMLFTSMYCNCENKSKALVDSGCEIDEYGTKIWKNSKGQFHRLNDPAVKWVNGTKEWWVNGERHRLNGPAVKYLSGSKAWYQNNKLHRLDGPAIEYANGTKYWYQNGKRHRFDGPAVEWVDGGKEWWINGEKLTKENFKNHPKTF